MKLRVTGQHRGKAIVLVVAAFMSAVLAIDAMQLIRPSPVAAMSCVATLIRAPTDAGELVSLHRDTIVHQSRLNSLPSALVAAVIFDHQQELTRSSAFTDCFGSAVGANLSLGPAQMRMSTAAMLDGRQFSSLSPTEFRTLRSRLRDPESNIAYAARELRALLERRNSDEEISASALVNNPAAMALAITEYRSGRMATSIGTSSEASIEALIEKSRVGANAVRTLNLMRGSLLAQFLNLEQDSDRIRVDIAEYIESISCESGMFNRRCARNSGFQVESISEP